MKKLLHRELSITLVLGKNLRIQRMMTEDEYSDDR